MTESTDTTILVVEDDAATRTFLADNLTADGFELLVAEEARDAVRLLEYKHPDLVVLDLGLPDGSGLDVLDRIRQADGLASRIDPSTPVLVLSGRADELDRIRGFERGADDYVAKPYSYPELLGRVQAILRRARGRRASGRLRVGDLDLDPASREVRIRGDRVDLSQKEFALLRTLAVGADARLHQGGAAARTCGAFARWVPPARSTATPAGCATSWRCTATATS